MAARLTAGRTDSPEQGFCATRYLEAAIISTPVVGKIMAPKDAHVVTPEIPDVEQGPCRCVQAKDLTWKKILDCLLQLF